MPSAFCALHYWQERFRIRRNGVIPLQQHLLKIYVLLQINRARDIGGSDSDGGGNRAALTPRNGGGPMSKAGPRFQDSTRSQAMITAVAKWA